MYKEIWSTDDLLRYIRKNYIFDTDLDTIGLSPDKLKDYQKKHDYRMGLVTEQFDRYSKKLRRTIQTELTEGRDFTKTGKRYLFTDLQAKRFLYTNSTINNYFLREMAELEGKPKFSQYFENVTYKLNEQNKYRYAEYTLSGAFTTCYTPTEDTQIKQLLLQGIFRDSIDNIFEYFGIDGDAYRKAFEDMQKLINEEDDVVPYCSADELADYPYNRSYGYHYYKLTRPLIYYRKDNYYLRNKPFLKK